jgi:hypothetical protein
LRQLRLLHAVVQLHQQLAGGREDTSLLRAVEQFFNFFHHGAATVHETGQTISGEKLAKGESIRPGAGDVSGGGGKFGITAAEREEGAPTRPTGANKFGSTSFERH